MQPKSYRRRAGRKECVLRASRDHFDTALYRSETAMPHCRPATSCWSCYTCHVVCCPQLTCSRGPGASRAVRPAGHMMHACMQMFCVLSVAMAATSHGRTSSL
eukprot:319318-Chlamydomonas_euryale.AAC.1